MPATVVPSGDDVGTDEAVVTDIDHRLGPLLEAPVHTGTDRDLVGTEQPQHIGVVGRVGLADPFRGDAVHRAQAPAGGDLRECLDAWVIVPLVHDEQAIRPEIDEALSRGHVVGEGLLHEHRDAELECFGSEPGVESVGAATTTPSTRCRPA